MPSLEDRLRNALRAEPLNARGDLEALEDGKIFGHVVSDSFVDLDYEDRRKLIRVAIEKAVQSGSLTTDDVQNISTLLTYTPAEWDTILTDTKN